MAQDAGQALAQLGGLSAQACAAMAQLAVPFTVASGDAIFRQHDQSDGLYLIEAGAVVVTGRTPGDGHVELARLGSGAMLGEFCLLDGGRRSADALAGDDCSGWRLDLARFAGLQEAGDPAALALAAALRAQVAARSHDLVSALAATAPEPAEALGADGNGKDDEACQQDAARHPCLRCRHQRPISLSRSPKGLRFFGVGVVGVGAA